MEWRFYFQLFSFTAGALLYMFLVVLLGGLRRLRRPEWLLLFGWLALFLFYAGALLGLNTTIEYHSPPPSTLLFAFLLAVVGLVAAPPLLVHAQAEFLARSAGTRAAASATAVALFYLPALYFLVVFLPVLFGQGLFEALDAVAAPAWRVAYGIWLGLAFLASAALQWKLAPRFSSAAHSRVARILAGLLLAGGALSLVTVWRGAAGASDEPLQILITLLIFLPVLAGALVIYFLIRQSLLGTGLQRSLVYSVVLAFLALIYLKLVLRLSEWLVPLGLPFEASVSILLFVFVLLIQPLQSRVAGVLERAFRRQTEQLQHLIAEIQQVARAGSLEELVTFAEQRIGKTLGLPGVRISLREGPPRPAGLSGSSVRFSLQNGAEEMGTLEAHYDGPTLSGETHAALQYLAEQLPAAVDLCRLLDEKVRLERELAERERLAVLGQMAASISHNLKNPLSSMKTLLQVQLENPALPESARRDCALAVAEIDRLSAKLAQLLHYARPPVRESAVEQPRTAVRAQLEQAAALLTPEAQRRGIQLTLADFSSEIAARCTEDAFQEIASNLLVNALEATPKDGTITIQVRAQDGFVILDIGDDGPGVPEEMRERIFQPFFTTKPHGTGLGLAIVKRRLAEIGGTIRCESPGTSGRKTSFIVVLPWVLATKTEEQLGRLQAGEPSD